MQFLVRKLILATLFVGILIIIIAVARGYRFSPSNKSLQPTGILVASSNPDGAKIYVNGELEGATNSNITVKPGVYTVEIVKDGYTSWSKELTIKGELVIKADALLFPQNPTLSPVTSLGVTKAVSSPTGDKIIIVSEKGDAEKDGIYLLENVRNPISRINPLKTLVLKSDLPQLESDYRLTDIDVEFAPEEDQILVSMYAEGLTDVNVITANASQTRGELIDIFLVDTTSQSEAPFRVTESVESIREAWILESTQRREKALTALKGPLSEVALSSFDVIAFSPDETKLLYTATESATLPLVIDPPIIAANQTPEQRAIEPLGLYIYDQEEDKNFQIGMYETEEEFAEATRHIMWYPSSAHLVRQEEGIISVLDYDGTNIRTVYSGPFEQDFLATSKDGRLFILTNFNSEIGIFDIYSVGLK